MAKFSFSGLDELMEELKELEQLPEKIKGLTVFDVLTDKFMQTHTKYSTLADMLAAGGFDINAFDDIDETELDDFVHQNTGYDSFDSLVDEAFNSLKL